MFPRCLPRFPLRGPVSHASLLLAVLAGCTPKDQGGDETAGDTSQDSGGGGGVAWRPSGEGFAYFVDGTTYNSAFRLELSRATPPEEGMAYWGWLSQGGANPISLGSIPVEGEDVFFEVETGVNGLTEGYDTFRAVQAAAESSEGEGVWAGSVNPKIYAVIQDLALASDTTDDGLGVLRSMQSDIEGIREAVREGADEAGSDLDAWHALAEAAHNAIDGANEDVDDNGDVVTWPGLGPLTGESGFVAQVLAGLDIISDQVEPGDPIKDFANYAYDCAQRVETHAVYARVASGSGSAGASVGSCESSMGTVVDELGLALDGRDDDESGKVDLITEGTVGCTVYYVNQMARMEVTVP